MIHAGGYFGACNIDERFEIVAKVLKPGYFTGNPRFLTSLFKNERFSNTGHTFLQDSKVPGTVSNCVCHLH